MRFVLESEDGRKVNCSIIWSIARVSPLLETGFDFGGMLFGVFYCDCHSASLFPVCCHIRNFLGNGDNQEGYRFGITAGTGILSFVVIWKHLVKYQNEHLEITFPGRRRKLNIENIIFDVDGTLWDSTGEVAKAWNLAVKELGIECESLPRIRLNESLESQMNVIADHLFPSASAAEKERALELCCMYEHEVLEQCEENLLYPGERDDQELAKTHKVCVVSNCQSGYIAAVSEKESIGTVCVGYGVLW